MPSVPAAPIPASPHPKPSGASSTGWNGSGGWLAAPGRPPPPATGDDRSWAAAASPRASIDRGSWPLWPASPALRASGVRSSCRRAVRIRYARELLAQLRDLDLQALRRGGRRPAVPQFVDQPLGRDDLVAMEQQQR